MLLAHPAIADVAVIGMPSAKWGESPLAVVVAADADLDEDVLEHCKGKLARFKLSRTVVFYRRHPPQPHRQGTEARTPRTLPRTTD